LNNFVENVKFKMRQEYIPRNLHPVVFFAGKHYWVMVPYTAQYLVISQ